MLISPKSLSFIHAIINPKAISISRLINYSFVFWSYNIRHDVILMLLSLDLGENIALEPN